LENARRDLGERLAPPRCTSNPENITQAPAGMVTVIAGDAAAFCRQSSPHRWLPGMISVPPFSAVKASTAAMVEIEIIRRGRGTV
jgi:hypothetical protein